MRERHLESNSSLLNLIVLLSIFLAVLTVTPITPKADAYTLTGQKWSSSHIKMYNRANVTGKYRNSVNEALREYNKLTSVNLSIKNNSETAWNNRVKSRNDVEWEARSTWKYDESTGVISKVLCTMNEYYADSYSQNKIKVVWEHEFGHSLGLDHVSGVKHVMYQSASTAFKNGVTTLTKDEINGINKLY